MNENENAKAYELRRLTADDVFPMFQIISKIGIREFKECFESEKVMQLVKGATTGKGTDDIAASIGMSVAIDIAGILFANIGKCKSDIYTFLAQLSGMTAKDIGELPMATFFEMIVDVIKKEEFKDFFKVAAKLLK